MNKHRPTIPLPVAPAAEEPILPAPSPILAETVDESVDESTDQTSCSTTGLPSKGASVANNKGVIPLLDSTGGYPKGGCSSPLEGAFAHCTSSAQGDERRKSADLCSSALTTV
jgi:hypothetical protein